MLSHSVQNYTDGELNMKFFIVLACVALAYAKRFDGDQVLTLYPKTPSHLRLIKEFGSFDGLADFWAPDTADLVLVGHKADIRFPASYLRVVKRKLDNAKMEYEVKIPNLQALVETQFDVQKPRLDGYDYNVYHTVQEITQWSKDIANQYPNLAKQETLLLSEEYREIPQLTLSTNENNPIFVIDCGIHAREWISPAVCQCFVNRMLENYGSDSGVTSILNKLTFVVFPVLNVDGYAYTWTDDRMWRKTRSNYGTVCTGVDPNRNFDAGWSGPGASSSPCSDTYYGPEVASEQLTKGLQNYVRANYGNIKAYVTFHSYSQVYIYPYSYKNEDASNADELDSLAAQSSAALRAVHGKSFTYGAGWSTFYLAAGGSDDFAIDNGVPISYTIELRDTGRYGFVLPENQIQPSCEEIYPALDVIANHIM